MPMEGDEPAEAIALAGQRLKRAGVPGSIILITDAVDASLNEELERIYQRDKTDVHILAMAAGPDVIPPAGSYPAPPLELDSLNIAARALGGSVTVVSSDKSDIRNLAARIERSISRVASEEGQQWRDAGYYLLIILALIMLFFFREGGSVSVE